MSHGGRPSTPERPNKTMKPSVKIVCVDDSRPEWTVGLYTDWPVKGCIYTVRELRAQGRDAPGKLWDGIPAVLVEELTNPPDPTNRHGLELAFKFNRFRLIRKKDEAEALRMSVKAAGHA